MNDDDPHWENLDDELEDAFNEQDRLEAAAGDSLLRTPADVIAALMKGEYVRWVPRHTSGRTREDYDPEGFEREVFIGRRQATVNEEGLLVDMTAVDDEGRPKFKHLIECVEDEDTGVGRYVLKG